jgi:nitrogen fixation/metabolism regulation signal transduction histidine kinase
MVEVSGSWRATHSVEERKAFLAAVINAIPTPVLVKDEQHVYLAVNDDQMGAACVQTSSTPGRMAVQAGGKPGLEGRG